MSKYSTAVLVACLMAVVLFGLTFVPQMHFAKATSKTITVPYDYPTIQAAVGNANSGDTVFVKSGTYNETITVDKSISLIGENSNTTTIAAPTVSTNTSTFQGLTTIQVNASQVKISNLTISNPNPMGIAISSSKDETQIIGNTLNGTEAISVFGAFASIKENILFGYFTGVSGGSTSNSNITDNTIVQSHSYGVKLEGSSFNNVWRNKIIGFAGYGIFISGNSNNITGNTITEKSDGISISSGSQNMVTKNSIANCTGIGLRIDQGAANNNTIIRNNFLNNVQQTSTYNVSNYWDNGKEGNYWSNYQTKYPNATEIDDSRIGNTPYTIDENNTDHYPLMQQIDISAPALTPTPSITPSPSIPEFPTWITLPLIFGTLVFVLMFKKRVKI